MLSPKSSPLGKLLSEYICVRITRMDAVDVGLFDRDWNNAIYFFMLNADERIYMRYGGRDAASPDTYLNLSSLELALEKGLELHRRYRRGELKKVERPGDRTVLDRLLTPFNRAGSKRSRHSYGCTVFSGFHTKYRLSSKVRVKFTGSVVVKV